VWRWSDGRRVGRAVAARAPRGCHRAAVRGARAGPGSLARLARRAAEASRVTLLLALDTSTSTAGVALFDGGRVLSERTWLAGREHSTRVLVEVEIALARVGRTQDELTGLVVARGPGSYTGVRVALSVAKGIAAALRVPVWGISSLDVLAFASPSDLPVRAVLEAGRGRYATALYEQAAPIEAARLMTLEQLESAIGRDTLIVGELRDEARAALAQ